MHDAFLFHLAFLLGIHVVILGYFCPDVVILGSFCHELLKSTSLILYPRITFSARKNSFMHWYMYSRTHAIKFSTKISDVNNFASFTGYESMEYLSLVFSYSTYRFL